MLFAINEMERAQQKMFEFMDVMERDPFNLRITKNITTADTVDCNNDNEHVSADDQGTTYYQLGIIITFMSVISLMFVSLAILSDKRVSSHPNNIIAYICLCDAYTFCQYFNRYIICGFSLNLYLERLFSWTFLQPYYTVAVKWFNIEIVTNRGDVLTWPYLLTYYD